MLLPAHAHTNEVSVELHFTDDDFKSAGRLGRRRLKNSAVPSAPKKCDLRLKIGNEKREPFLDKTNVQDRTLPISPPAALREGNDVALQGLLMLSAPQCINLPVTPPTTPPVCSESPANHTLNETTALRQTSETVRSEIPLSSDKVDTSHEVSILDEVNGLLMPVTFSGCGESPANETLDESTCPSNHTLDESYSPANHTLNESTSEWCEWLPDSPSDSPPFSPTPPQSVSDDNMQIEFLKSLDKEELLQIALRQTSEIDHLISERETHLKEISELKLLGNFNHEFKRKFEAERRCRVRLLDTNQRLAGASTWLTKRQMLRLSRKSNRGLKWLSEEIREGLILKMKCGSSGYSSFVSSYPLLPSLRSLQESVQYIRFEPGLLHEVFDLLRVLGTSLPDGHKDCEIVLDEMSISQGQVYCNSLQKWLGLATLPGHNGVACKALLFILAGISKRWKIAVAVEFTNKKEDKYDKNNPTGKAYANIIRKVANKAEDASLRVCGVTSDMGADNLAFWREFGIVGNRKEVRSSTVHPSREDDQLFFLPDPVHLMKAAKKCMESNTIITLPPKIVEEFKLPTDVVDYRHVDDLLEFEEDYELKEAFRLRKQNVRCEGQFKSMNVGTVKAVVCQRTGVGLNLLAQEKQDRSYETTGWFIIFINTFFALVLCRHKGLAISQHNPTAYNKAIKLIHTMDYIFQNMRVGKDGTWKPEQRGMRVLCRSLLGLIDYFLTKRSYKLLMLGRFSSDCIENLFSLIRLAQAIPNAAQFLQYLKVVTLSQYSEAIKGSSYDFDESSDLPKDFLEEARIKAKERAQTRFYNGVDEISKNPIKQLTNQDLRQISSWERRVIYDMAGAAVVRLQKSSIKFCQDCLNSLEWKGEFKHPDSTITEMKEYTFWRSGDGKIKNTDECEKFHEITSEFEDEVGVGVAEEQQEDLAVSGFL